MALLDLFTDLAQIAADATGFSLPPPQTGPTRFGCYYGGFDPCQGEVRRVHKSIHLCRAHRALYGIKD